MNIAVLLLYTVTMEWGFDNASVARAISFPTIGKLPTFKYMHSILSSLLTDRPHLSISRISATWIRAFDTADNGGSENQKPVVSIPGMVLNLAHDGTTGNRSADS